MKRWYLLLLSVFLSLGNVSFAASNIKIIIDPGHGGKDDGSVSNAGDKESDICLQLAEAIQDYARENGIVTEMTRTKKNQTLTFEQRSGFKPHPGMKTYYISVHFDNDKNPAAKGARIRYSNNTKTSAEAKKLAETLSKSMEKLTGAPAKIEQVDALNFMKNQVPSIIVEPGRMSYAADLKKIKEKDYRRDVAMFIVQAVMAQ